MLPDFLHASDPAKTGFAHHPVGAHGHQSSPVTLNKSTFSTLQVIDNLPFGLAPGCTGGRYTMCVLLCRHGRHAVLLQQCMGPVLRCKVDLVLACVLLTCISRPYKHIKGIKPQMYAFMYGVYSLSTERDSWRSQQKDHCIELQCSRYSMKSTCRHDKSTL